MDGRPPPGPGDGAVTAECQHAGWTLSRGSPGLLGLWGRPATDLPRTRPLARLATRALSAAAATVSCETSSVDAGTEAPQTGACALGSLARCFG